MLFPAKSKDAARVSVIDEAGVSYRFYILNEKNRISGVEILEAPNDRVAASRAAQLCENRNLPGFELWDLARRIAAQAVDGQG
jgi:hypothetical protein